MDTKAKITSRILNGILALSILGAAAISTGILNQQANDINISAESKTLLGDSNADGTVNIADLITTKRYVLGISKLTTEGFYNADINGDGRVNSLDVSALIKVLISESISESTYIYLNGSSITVDGQGAEVNGSIITITAAGDYIVSGTLDDGQIMVKAGDEDKVNIIFNGVNLNCSYNAPVYVENADKVVITLNGSSVNTINDAETYTETEEGIDATIYSKDDLTINGTGSLTINANYSYAIRSNDDLKINGGNIEIKSAGDAIRGKDSVTIKNGNITIDSGGDGIKSTKGALTISGGAINIKASNDALQAETTVDISDGIIIACGDRGITATEAVNITGGTVLATATDNQAANVTSTQGTLLMTYAAEWKKGNAIDIMINDTVVLNVIPIKKFTYALVSSPQLTAEASYSVLTGGVQMQHSTSTEGIFAMTGGVTEFTGIQAIGEKLAATESIINLSNSGPTVTGTGVFANGNIVTISQPGKYQVYGSIDDGQIVVDVDKTVYSNPDTDNVTLVMNNVNIANKDSSPIYVESIKDKCTIELAKGTTNYITDGSTRTDTTIEGAIYSKDDLNIKGSGTLIVKANYLDGIVSKDDLKVKNGNIQITSADDGLKGKDSVTIEGGSVNITASGDGIVSTNTEETTKGYINILGGDITIKAANDGIKAETNVNISGGNFNIYTYQGSKFSGYATTNSAKGIKAVSDITISGGTFVIDSSDDCLHSNGTLNISGGTFTMATGDDGIHADTDIIINSGTIEITKSYEGIEGSNITINDGTICITASDDGLNVAGGDGSATKGPGGWGQGSFVTTNSALNINGGYIYIDAYGDGLDSNGVLNMNGGLVIVNGPTNDGNSAVDSDGAITATGGTVIAVGSLGMAMGPNSSASTQSSILTNVSVNAGTLINISDSTGKSVLTFKPSKNIRSIMFTSPDLVTSQTYTISTGGTYTGGTNVDGYYTGGTYSGGSTVATATAALVVSGGGMRPGPRF